MGLGNWLLGDEGVGVHLIEALEGAVGDRGNVTLIDGGVSLDAPFIVEEADRLIVLDAVDAGGPPGAVYRFGPEGLEGAVDGPVSLHQWSALDTLRTLALLGRLPRDTVIFGIQPESVDWGTELSATVRGRIPDIVSLVLKELEMNNRIREV